MDELTAIIALSRLPGLNTIQKRQVIESVQSVADLFRGRATTHDHELNNRIKAFTGWKEIERDLMLLSRMKVTVMTFKDRTYPALLKQIPDPPVVLYKKGPSEIDSDAIAIVGARKASVEGINLAEKIGQTLASLGIIVVSGMARGIDSAAHRGALKAKGKTVAVLGCGMDICYPPENKGLFAKIGEEGAVLTEYGLAEQPLPYHFPERNRIIAGLSKGVLVVEASRKSGSLITARLGLEYGREVMSIPGSIFHEEYKGANMLIKEGARLIDGIEDILLNCFPRLTLQKEQTVDMDREEGYIYSIIGFDKIHVDEVIDKSKMETKQVMALLTRLEMKDLIRQFPGGFYIRK
jgi:DNA processing protein